ncbi:MAG: TPM domain-containing protein, partial [Acidimicrobiia bacterium]|nr:TPM domain-containing protein [Acidimicrobiia bacterium]
MKRALVAIALVVVVAAPPAAAQTEAPASCPPVEGIVCDGWVTDAAGVVADDAVLEEAVQRVVEDHGHQIAVVIAPSSGDRTPRALAEAIGNTWGVGDADADDGIVVLVSLEERRTEIVTGSGLTVPGLSSVASAGDTGFRNGDFDAGIQAILGALAIRLGIEDGTGGGTGAGGSIAFGATVFGTVGPGDAETWTFEAEAGDLVDIRTDGVDGFDTFLRLRSPSGAIVGEDDDGGGGLDSRIQTGIERSGTHTIEVSGFSGTAGSYRLTLTRGSAPGDGPPPLPTLIGGALLVGTGAIVLTNARRNARTRKRLRREERVDEVLGALEPTGEELPLVADFAVAPTPTDLDVDTAAALAALREVEDRHRGGDRETLEALWYAGALEVVDVERLREATREPLELRASGERPMLEDAVQAQAREALDVPLGEGERFDVAVAELGRLVGSLRPHRVAAARRRAGETIADALTPTAVGPVVVTARGGRVRRARPGREGRGPRCGSGGGRQARGGAGASRRDGRARRRRRRRAPPRPGGGRGPPGPGPARRLPAW